MEAMKWYPSHANPGVDCIRQHHTQNYVYEEFSCLYPTIGASYFSFEKTYDPVPVRDFMRENHWVPMLAIVGYFSFIAAGQLYFSTRPPMNFRRSLAVWNLLLSVFSFIGFVRMFPQLVHNWKTYSWRENFCHDPANNVGLGSTGFWGQAFVLSKFPELIDTFFIVVHKKPLIFLHWYHHISVLLFCWFGYVHNPPTGLIFSTMNYAVHAVMYFYYFLMAVHMKPRWFKPVWITVAQISQMMLGCIVTAVGCYLLLVEKPPGCILSHKNITPSLIMYGSYLVLFVQFFFSRYQIQSSTKKNEMKSKAA